MPVASGLVGMRPAALRHHADALEGGRAQARFPHVGEERVLTAVAVGNSQADPSRAGSTDPVDGTLRL
jgi:hypothetical protein